MGCRITFGWDVRTGGDGKYRIKFTNFIVSKFLNKIYFLLYLAYFSVQKLVVETSSSRTLDTQNLGNKLESWEQVGKFAEVPYCKLPFLRGDPHFANLDFA